MAHEYRVSGYHGFPIHGAIGPAELDGCAEWVTLEERPDLVGRITARLGSEVSPRQILLGVFGPLCGWLEGEPLDRLLALLPPPLERELRQVDVNVNALLRAPTGAGDYLAEVAEVILQPPWRAQTYVRAGFAAAKRALPTETSKAIAARLPAELAELWTAAR